MTEPESASARSTEPTPEQVVEALQAGGWLLEQQTATRLAQHEFKTTMGVAYEDPDDPTVSREVDVVGVHRRWRKPELGISLTARVIAECKYSSMPYAFVGRPLEMPWRRRQPTEHLLRYDSIEQQWSRGNTVLTRQVPAWTWLGLDAIPGSPSLQEFRATQMTRLDRQKTWKADNRTIFTSLVFPLAKALRALQAEAMPAAHRSQSKRHDPRYDWADISLFFPVVVTTAPLYVVDATAERPEAEIWPWVTVTRHLRSRSIQGAFNIDVVSAEYLDNWITARVRTFSSAVETELRADPKRFLTHTSVEAPA